MSIPCKVIRPLMHGGERFIAGQVLKLQPLAAANLISSGRAELIDEADREAVRAAVHDDVVRALREAGRPVPQPHLDDPRWISRS